ncbi:unnamed protein product [Meganyctiphanes norvegica]|uniref:Uncharacterized protein n=1 Tax=Meganyctiphanes norvegica TaxID=48144 RepID=A0AAV2SJE9_MEGNR
MSKPNDTAKSNLGYHHPGKNGKHCCRPRTRYLMDQRYLREWISLIPKPPANFYLNNESRNNNIQDFDIKAPRLNQVTLQGKSNQTECFLSNPIEQEHANTSRSLPQTSNAAECFKKKRGRPFLKGNTETIDMENSISKGIKRAFGVINNKSKSSDNSFKDQKAESTTFIPPKFSTPSKNDSFINKPQLKTVNCQPNMSSIRMVRKGPAPASKKDSSHRSVMYSPGTLQKKLSSIQKSQPDAANTFKFSKTERINNNPRKMYTDQRISKKNTQVKSSLRNLRPKVSQSPPSNPLSSCSERSDDSDIDLNITQPSEDDDIDETYKEIGCEQQMLAQNKRGSFKGLDNISKITPDKNLKYVKEPITVVQSKLSHKKIDTKKVFNKPSMPKESTRPSLLIPDLFTKASGYDTKKLLNKSSMTKESTQPSLQIPNRFTNEIGYDEKNSKNLSTNHKQLYKSKNGNAERQRNFKENEIFSKKRIPKKSTTSQKLLRVESFSKEKVCQQPMLLEEISKSNKFLPIKERKSMYKTIEQLGTLPSKKKSKEIISREFIVENQTYESPKSKKVKKLCSKESGLSLAEKKIGVINENKMNKIVSRDNSYVISESEDHGELSSSGYLSKTSQDLTNEDNISNNSICHPTDELIDPNKYTNLFFKDGKKINRNVLKRHSRVLGEALSIIKDSDLKLGLGLKRLKSLLDDYLDNPKSFPFSFESKYNDTKKVTNKKLKLQTDSPDTSYSCELEEIEVTMTLRNSEPEHSFNKEYHSAPLKNKNDSPKTMKNKNVFANTVPMEKVQKGIISQKCEDMHHIYSKTNDSKLKLTAESTNFNLEENGNKIVQSYSRKSEIDKDDTESPQISKEKGTVSSSSSEDSSESTSSDSYSTDDELVADELLAESTGTITNNLCDKSISNDFCLTPKLSLEYTSVNDMTEKYTPAKNVQSDLNLSSESNDEEECFNNSLNFINSKEKQCNEYSTELNFRDTSVKEYNTTDSKENVENRKRRVVTVDNSSDLKITIQRKLNECLDKKKQDKEMEQNLINNSFQDLSFTNYECLDKTKPTNSENCDPNYQLPWARTSLILNDDLALSENSSPPSSTKKHRISWNKRKEWDNDFDENEDEIDDVLSEGMENEEKGLSEEEIENEDNEYDTELDYEIDEINEEKNLIRQEASLTSMHNLMSK